MTVARADAKPGRRRAEPQGRTRRGRAPRPRSPRPAPPRARSGSRPRDPGADAAAQAGPRAPLAGAPRAGRVGAADAGRRPGRGGPVDAVRRAGWVANAGAVTLTTTYAFALAVRTGGRPVLTGALTVALACAAVLTRDRCCSPRRRSRTATIGAVLGVMVTIPAARFPLVARECVVAVLVAVVAAFAANAYDPRSRWCARATSSSGSRWSARWRWPTGSRPACTASVAGGCDAGQRPRPARDLPGLHRGPRPMGVARRWCARVERTTTDLHDLIGAVPHPIEFLLGIPALAWGVSTRARRRQGWWGTGFGAAALAVVATGLLDPDLSLVEYGHRDGVLRGGRSGPRLPRHPGRQLPLRCARPTGPAARGGLGAPSGARPVPRPALSRRPPARCSVAAMAREPTTAAVVAEMVANVLTVSVAVPGSRSPSATPSCCWSP